MEEKEEEEERKKEEKEEEEELIFTVDCGSGSSYLVCSVQSVLPG